MEKMQTIEAWHDYGEVILSQFHQSIWVGMMIQHLEICTSCTKRDVFKFFELLFCGLVAVVDGEVGI